MEAGEEADIMELLQRNFDLPSRAVVPSGIRSRLFVIHRSLVASALFEVVYELS
jgi:hypothetical protein